MELNVRKITETLKKLGFERILLVVPNDIHFGQNGRLPRQPNEISKVFRISQNGKW